jgi:hypothetical protein
MKKYRAIILAALGLAIIAAIVFGVQVIERMIFEAHPRAVQRALASWEDDYRKVENIQEFHRNIDMLVYIRDHYPYENMPDYKDSEVGRDLALQRAHTTEVIVNALREYSGQDYGDDEKAWLEWPRNNRLGVKKKTN